MRSATLADALARRIFADMPARGPTATTEQARRDSVGTGHPVTPDGRYFVVRGRLWRMSDPSLSPERRQSLVDDLMAARRGLAKSNTDRDARQAARAEVDRCKRGLGERGAVWWTDGAPDYNRHLARNTPYADWFDQIRTAEEKSII